MTVPPWMRRWPQWIAALAVALLAGAAVLAVLSIGERPPTGEDGWEARLVFSILLMPAPVMGALIASRQPASWYGWVWLTLGLGGGLLEFASGYVTHSVAVEELPAAPYVGVLSGVGWGGLFMTIPFVLLLFPTGHLPSPRWRHLARFALVCGIVSVAAGVFVPGELGTAPIENPLGVDGELGELIGVIVIVATMVVLVSTAPAAASLVVRYRAAVGQERRQIKWFALAASLWVLMFATDWVWEFDGVVEALKEAVPIALLPMAIAVAILRHRLYDIDRIISRTVSYTLLTMILAGMYAALVFVLRRVTPWQGQLPVAMSTLGVAALFNPLRSRLQATVDRRFNRSRYDARATMERFSRMVRSETELSEVGDLLVAVTARAIEPRVVALWLRDTGNQSTRSAP